MKKAVSDFLQALSLLTRISVSWAGKGTEQPVRLHPVTLPFVGAVLGGILGALAYLVSGFPRPVAGVVLLTAWVAITGGFHWDGWADAWETAMSPVSSEEKTRIRKDPHLGVFGMIALSLGILAKGVFLGTFRLTPTDLIAVAVSSRGVLPILLLGLKALARGVPVSEGLGKTFIDEVRPSNGLVAAGLSLTIILATAGGGAAIALMASILVSFPALVWVLRRQDALSGDFMGLCIECLEIVGILALGLAGGEEMPILHREVLGQWGF